MVKILIFIKHHFKFLWKIIEGGNGMLFSILYKPKLFSILPQVFKEFTLVSFTFRRLNLLDAKQLHSLIISQEADDLEYFHPHGLDMKSIENQFNNRAFLMMGVFEADKIIGYFFLRFFWNKKCFVGRLIDKNYRGKGIGNVMNSIMYEISWRMDFRCLSTISRNNNLVMHAHSRNSNMIVLKELQDDYLLVEFIKKDNDSQDRTDLTVFHKL
jgi:hypothetical protein